VENRVTDLAMEDSLPKTFYDDLKPELHRRIASALRGARTVVDLGCGSCGLAFFLAESNQQHVIGVDISGADFPGQTNAAGHGPGNVECVKEDAKTLTFLGAGECGCRGERMGPARDGFSGVGAL
jgi:SAM-dependent methyltransferase